MKMKIKVCILLFSLFLLSISSYVQKEAKNKQDAKVGATYIIARYCLTVDCVDKSIRRVEKKEFMRINQI